MPAGPTEPGAGGNDRSAELMSNELGCECMEDVLPVSRVAGKALVRGSNRSAAHMAAGGGDLASSIASIPDTQSLFDEEESCHQSA